MFLQTCDCQALHQLLFAWRWLINGQDSEDWKCQHPQRLGQGETVPSPQLCRCLGAHRLEGVSPCGRHFARTHSRWCWRNAKNCTLWRRSLWFLVKLWWMNMYTFWYKYPLVCSINTFLTQVDISFWSPPFFRHPHWITPSHLIPPTEVQTVVAPNSTQLLSLNCFIHGDDPERMFTVKILKNKNVSILKGLIKEKKRPITSTILPHQISTSGRSPFPSKNFLPWIRIPQQVGQSWHWKRTNYCRTRSPRSLISILSMSLCVFQTKVSII